MRSPEAVAARVTQIPFGNDNQKSRAVLSSYLFERERLH